MIKDCYNATYITSILRSRYISDNVMKEKNDIKLPNRYSAPPVTFDIESAC